MKESPAVNFPNDHPLPSKVFGKYGGWGSVAQQYPIFSQTWFKYRILTFILPMGLLAASLGLSLFVIPESNAKLKFALAMLFTWISIASALVLGRGVAVLISKAKWSERHISAGVIMAIVFGVIVAIGLFRIEHNFEAQFVGEYKQELQQKKQTDLAFIDSEAAYQNLPAYVVVKNLFLLLFFAWLGGIFDLVSYFRQRRAMKDVAVEQQLALYQKERNEAELRLSVLASQVEPHFLFNTLSGVRSAILSDPQMGVAIIDNLVEYLRATIPQLRTDGSCSQVRLGSQMQAIRAYLGVIKFRIPRLSFDVDFDPSLAELFIPPLMLISLVENAVKHGIELKKGLVHIAVKAERVNLDGQEKLILTVRDDGLGFANSVAGTGIGLSNIRERLRQLYQDQAALSLETNDENGVTARIILPTDTFN
ncbi:two-component sensor histidine kinase [Oxalobacteraceae bacterium GrIS 2.11]